MSSSSQSSDTGTASYMTTSGGGGVGTSSVSGGGGEGGSSIALLNSQITGVTPEKKMEWLAAGEALDPTTLIVVGSDQSQSCGAPVFDFGSFENHHQILVGLPQTLQKVGKYDLSTIDVIAFGSTWIGDGMWNGEGGSAVLNAGTIEVVSIDTATVNVRLEGLTTPWTSLNGDYLAKRCP